MIKKRATVRVNVGNADRSFALPIVWKFLAKSVILFCRLKKPLKVEVFWLWGVRSLNFLLKIYPWWFNLLSATSKKQVLDYKCEKNEPKTQLECNFKLFSFSFSYNLKSPLPSSKCDVISGFHRAPSSVLTLEMISAVSTNCLVRVHFYFLFFYA